MTDEFWDDINISASEIELAPAPASIPAAVAVSVPSLESPPASLDLTEAPKPETKENSMLKLLTRLKNATSAAAQPVKKLPVDKESDGKEYLFGPPVLPGIIKTSINAIDDTAKSFGMPPAASGFLTAINVMSKSFDNFYSFLSSS